MKSSVDLYPVPQRIDRLETDVTEKSIQLSWTRSNEHLAGRNCRRSRSFTFTAESSIRPPLRLQKKTCTRRFGSCPFCRLR